jgi:hydroxyethylthiazole kinase-like sugar kinase family protein
MNERYWVTGVQLGLLQVGDEKERKKLINRIINEQFITHIKCNVADKIIKELKKRELKERGV